MRRLLVLALGIAGVAALVAFLVRNTRFGAGLANEVVNPYLVRRGIAGSGASELGTLEHVGRTTGTRRLTPLRPVPTEAGFRIAVPLGERSQWARNVLAAGHCRMQLHDVVYELDEPVLLAASEVPEIPAPVAWALDRLGVEYLVLRRFAEAPGQLPPADATVAPVEHVPASVEAADIPAPASAADRVPFRSVTNDPDRDALEHALAGRGPYELFACDPGLADTAAFCAAYGFALEDSANTIIVAGKASAPVHAACVVLATHRLDVNRAVRRRLGTRKASFASAAETQALTGHEIGGVTVFGLPAGLPVLVDAAVMARERIVLGGGSRSWKVLAPPSILRTLDGVEVIEGLARPVEG